MQTATTNTKSAKSAKSNKTVRKPAPKKVAPSTKEIAPDSKPARGTKLAPLPRMKVRLASFRKRWAGVAKTLEKWSSPLGVTAGEVNDALAIVSEALDKLPEDFTPPRKGKGKAAVGLVRGARVTIAERVRSKYEDVLEEDEIGGVFTIERVTKGKVVCSGPGGRVILPRGHVALEGATTDDSTSEVEA